jgi:hypothetical protein
VTLCCCCWCCVLWPSCWLPLWLPACTSGEGGGCCCSHGEGGSLGSSTGCGVTLAYVPNGHSCKQPKSPCELDIPTTRALHRACA